MKIPKYLLIFILFAFIHKSEGQVSALATNKQKSEIKVLAKSYVDSIVIRWAPSTAPAWSKGLKTGYFIQRCEVNLLNNSKSNYFALTSMPIKALTLEEMKLKLPKENTFASIAAQCLYGKSFNLSMKLKGDGQIADKATELESRYSFAMLAADNSAAVAEAIASRFTDTKIEKGKSYLYRVFYANIESVPSYDIDTGYFFINTNDKTVTPFITDIEAIGSQNIIELSWTKDTVYHTFSGYYIERSDDQGKSFKRLNKMPLISPKPFKAESENARIYYYDSIPKNYYLYKYRIIGITPFAELSEPSAVKSVMGSDKTPPPSPEIMEAKSWKDNTIRIKWKMPANKSADLSGFFVRRGNGVNGPYINLNDKKLSMESREFIDGAPITNANNYYQVVAMDTAMNLSYSLTRMAQIIDTIPPGPPVGLNGSISSKGILTVSWRPPKENDVLGYRVLSANAKDHPYIQCSGKILPDTVFTDTLNLKTLTKEIYIKTIALDRNYNPSIFSETLRLVKPDIVPPTSPVILSYSIKDTEISINWIKSSSDDVRMYYLMRRITGKNWIKIDSCSGTILKYPLTDKSIENGLKYQYNMVAVDESGLKSELSNTIEILFKQGKKDKLESKYISLKPVPDENILKLSWESMILKGDAELLIFKAVNGSAFQQITSLSKNALYFNDKLVPAHNKYEYMIKARFKDGSESNFSEILSYVN